MSKSTYDFRNMLLHNVDLVDTLDTACGLLTGTAEVTNSGNVKCRAGTLLSVDTGQSGT